MGAKIKADMQTEDAQCASFFAREVVQPHIFAYKEAIMLCRKNLVSAAFLVGIGIGLILSCIFEGILPVIIGLALIALGAFLLKN